MQLKLDSFHFFRWDQPSAPPILNLFGISVKEGDAFIQTVQNSTVAPSCSAIWQIDFVVSMGAIAPIDFKKGQIAPIDLH